MGVNGSIAPIAPGTRDRAAHRSRRCAARARRRAPARADRARPDGRARSIGFNGPMVGTFHAAGEVRAPVAASRAAVADDAAHRPRRGVGVGARDRGRQLDGRGVHRAVERRRDRAGSPRRDPTPTPRPAVLFIGRHEPRKGLERAARRVGGHRPRRACSGSSASGRRPRSCSAAGTPATSSGSAGHRRRRNASRCGARRVLRARRCAASRSGSCCSRRWPPGRADRRVRRSRATATSPASGRTRCSCRPATSARCATRCGGSLDDAGAARAPRRRRAHERAEQFSMRAWPSATSSSTSTRCRRLTAPACGVERSVTDSRRPVRRLTAYPFGRSPLAAVIIIVVIIVVVVLFFVFAVQRRSSGCATGSTPPGRRSACSSSAATISSRTSSRR